MSDDDAELVALIDNELDESSRTALWRVWRRMSGCASVTRSCGRLARRSRPPSTRCSGRRRSLVSAPRFPPTNRFAARLGASPGSPSAIWRRELSLASSRAGAALWAASAFGLIGEQDNWRSAVVDYTNLYTNETFSPLNPDSALQAAELKLVGAKVGANLTPENIALPGLRFTTAFMLAYEGSPLGVIAYVDPSGAPVLFCIHANRAPDAPMRSERRGDLALAWWARGGRGHLVIGHISEERAVALAQMLEKRV